MDTRGSLGFEPRTGFFLLNAMLCQENHSELQTGTGSVWGWTDTADILTLRPGKQKSTLSTLLGNRHRSWRGAGRRGRFCGGMGLDAGCACAAFAHTLPSLATGRLQQQVLLFPLRSLRRKNRIIVAAGSERQKNVERKKSIKITFFSPFQARCAESQR